MIGHTARQSPAARTSLIAPLLIFVVLALPGCVTVFAPDCARFKQEEKATNYETRYRYSEHDTATEEVNYRALPKPRRAAARLYKVRLSDDRISVCSHLDIHKNLYIERNAKRGMVLEQIREFYTNGGQLIAAKREDVTAQLARSGHYYASVPLPIPEGAPAGKYRIVSKLVVRSKRGAREEILARATAAFEVVRSP